MTRLIIVDDHKIVRDGLKALLIGNDHYEVSGETDTPGAVESLINSLQPDLMVLDLKLPGESGIEVAKRIKATYPELKIVMLTAEANTNDIRKAVKSGIDALVSKELEPLHYIKIFDKVMAGGRYIGQQFTDALVGFKDSDNLTDREIEIVQGFANGLSYKEIGAQLNISARTVETHKKNIQEKLKLSTLADMVKYAIREGIVKA